jgi:hypothetical protein
LNSGISTSTRTTLSCKGYPPENAETPANRVGRVEQLLFQFLEKVSKPLENTFAMVRKKMDLLEMACHASPLDSPLSVIFNVHPRSHSYRLVYLPWTLPFTLAFIPHRTLYPPYRVAIFISAQRDLSCAGRLSHNPVNH